jgi:anaerobic selenocysteine-containing dehydrogenase
LRRRVIALVAAYAIALASLLASFGVARAAAAEAAGVPGGIICHTHTADQQAPSPSTDTGKICDNCCVGCLMLMAALPPPPAKISGAPQSAAQLLTPPAIAVVAAAPHGKSHRSRAPPLSA